MNVDNACTALLSNYEVFNLLKTTQSEGKRCSNLATVCYETLAYLEKTPCVKQNDEIFAAFIKALQRFNLSKSEKLQLVNNRPTSLVELQVTIEDIEERLTEDEIQQLLDLISQMLPPLHEEKPEVEEEMGEEEEEEEAADEDGEEVK